MYVKLGNGNQMLVPLDYAITILPLLVLLLLVLVLLLLLLLLILLCRKLRMWSHLLKKPLMENFIFWPVKNTIVLHEKQLGKTQQEIP